MGHFSVPVRPGMTGVQQRLLRVPKFGFLKLKQGICSAGCFGDNLQSSLLKMF
jgi:hypothetical protein